MNNYNHEWYGNKAKILEQNDNYTVIDYGCNGHGIVTNYILFDGIQLCFLDFDTEQIFSSQQFNPDIIQITHCRAGRYECEFANHMVSHLPEGCFGVAGTKYLPVSFAFPLSRCYAVSLVIDRQNLSEQTRKMMEMIPIDLDHMGETLNIEKKWYVSTTPPKLQHLFSEIYEAQGVEDIGYFKIKAIELLYHMNQLTQNNGCDFKYYDKGQIQITKDIRNYMVSHPETKLSLEELTGKKRINLSLFHTIFHQIYGDTPYSYLKKYKMNLAAQMLLESETKIGNIAVELGYNNASKFAKAFKSVYGELPKDYRKHKK